MARVSRTARAVVTSTVAAVVGLALGGVGRVPGASAATGATTGATIALVAQPTGVEVGGQATITVRVAGAPTGAEVDADVFPPTTAAGVRAARRGELPERRIGYLPAVALADVTHPDGTASLVLRVVDTAPRADEEVRMASPGVYPVRIRVTDPAGGTVAQLVTFLIRPEPRTLPVTVVLPLPAAPSTGPDGAVSVDADAQAHALAVTELLHLLPSFPFAVAPRPELIGALARTNPVLTSRLAAALGTRTVLAMPYVRLDVAGMVAADLANEVGRQLAAGEQAVADALPGTRADRRVWMVDGPLDTAALVTLRTLGVQHLLTTPAQLEPVPTAPALRPVRLDPTTGLGVLVADPDLSVRLAPAHDATAAAVDLVAELSALVFTDQVGRGLVLAPEPGFAVVPEFWRALASSLAGPSMLRAAGLDELLRTTLPDRDTTYSLRTERARDELPLAQSLFVTRVALDHIGTALPPTTTRFAGLLDRTTIAASIDLAPAERAAYFDAVTARVNPVRNAVTVRLRDRITLAGKNGVVPLSLVNALDEAVTVRLRVVSDKLRVTDDDRLVTVPALGETPLRLNVQARTSAWQFPASIQLSTPDGAEALGTPASLELRAVGLSGLGLGISFGALAVLATWWVTHARRRRRARRDPATSLAPP
jgi:hypothetical protein